ncbi:MAG: dihydrolipoyl dehydrogenase [Candidatus Omnitrophica bacterium]|nr:dihydrolipoyl dehydrogenase [Candidatus Omnitrophota bacterium]
MRSYDLAIIGSGPGGYVTGIYAARHGLITCLIEKDLVGGTCLNKGCIPTKSLLNSVSIISKLKHAPDFGITIDAYRVDFEKVMSRKDEVVSRLRAGVESLLKANKIELIKGEARLASADTIAIDGREEIKAKNIIIATGSSVAHLPNINIDNDNVLSSESILNIKRVPRSLVIIGGGVIGCEFASLFANLASKVTIVEMTDRLIPGQSREASKKLEYNFKRSGIDVLTSSMVESLSAAGSVTVRVSGGKIIEAEKALVSIGRVSNIKGLALEGVGIKTYNDKICVNEFLATDIPNIYAVGDCVPGPQLAHKASYDGILACDNILGKSRKVDYSNIPNCIWTEPEIASVGLPEEAAKVMHQDIKVAKFTYLASGKAYLEGETEGFVKIVGVPSTGEIIGVEIFGKDACNLIGEATLAKTRGVKIEDWGRVVHGHPTLSEIFQESCYVFLSPLIPAGRNPE